MTGHIFDSSWPKAPHVLPSSLSPICLDLQEVARVRPQEDLLGSPVCPQSEAGKNSAQEAMGKTLAMKPTVWPLLGTLHIPWLYRTLVRNVDPGRNGLELRI